MGNTAYTVEQMRAPRRGCLIASCEIPYFIVRYNVCFFFGSG